MNKEQDEQGAREITEKRLAVAKKFPDMPVRQREASQNKKILTHNVNAMRDDAQLGMYGKNLLPGRKQVIPLENKDKDFGDMPCRRARRQLEQKVKIIKRLPKVIIPFFKK